MRNLKLILVLCYFLNICQVMAQEQSLTYKITKNLRCLVCQGQSVYDSDSEFANSLKIVVQRKVDEGMSENDIYEFLKTKYGEWILYDPGLNKKTYILWILPILLFLIGGAIIIKKLKLKKHKMKFLKN